MSEAAHNEAMERSNDPALPSTIEASAGDVLADAVRLHLRCFPWMVGSGQLRDALKAFEKATGATSCIEPASTVDDGLELYIATGFTSAREACAR
jgi:hypothetical protein